MSIFKTYGRGRRKVKRDNGVKGKKKEEGRE